jgi:transposase
MPGATILEISSVEQELMLAELRRARYGYLLTLHIILLCGAGYNPTEISECLFCSRSSVYRAVEAYQRGELGYGPAASSAAAPESELLERWQRMLSWLIKQPPRLFGWCRTRWSCATLALTIEARTQVVVSRETVRRELQAQHYVWKRAKLKTRDSDPERARRLAKIRDKIEHLRPWEALFFIDELDIALLPKVGGQWMLKGTQVEIPTPGKNQKRYLAAALDWRTGEIRYVVGVGKNNFLFRQLLALLEESCGPEIKTIYVVCDNYKIHKAQAVERWLEQHPRFERLWTPTYCPKANPIERVFWEVHDKCTRNHTRKQMWRLVGDVEQYLETEGPWPYELSKIYFTPEVDAALNQLYLEESLGIAA